MSVFDPKRTSWSDRFEEHDNRRVCMEIPEGLLATVNSREAFWAFVNALIKDGREADAI
jgi:hypothetical protein